jgi:hypothetical protein
MKKSSNCHLKQIRQLEHNYTFCHVGFDLITNNICFSYCKWLVIIRSPCLRVLILNLIIKNNGQNIIYSSEMINE